MREYFLNKYTCEFHMGRLSEDDIHTIEYSAYEQLKKENEALKNKLLTFEGMTFSENQEIAELKKQLDDSGRKQWVTNQMQDLKKQNEILIGALKNARFRRYPKNQLSDILPDIDEALKKSRG